MLGFKYLCMDFLLKEIRQACSMVTGVRMCMAPPLTSYIQIIGPTTTVIDEERFQWSSWLSAQNHLVQQYIFLCKEANMHIQD